MTGWLHHYWAWTGGNIERHTGERHPDHPGGS